MATPDRLLDLLVRWEDERRGGRKLTPEELCPDDLALCEALRARIRDRERFRPFWSGGENTLPDPTQPRVAALPRVEGLEVLGTIGRGGAGVVYKARQTKLDRLVALKMVLAEGRPAPRSGRASSARPRPPPG